MLRSNQEMTDEIPGQKEEGEVLLTELSYKELLKFVPLDAHGCEL